MNYQALIFDLDGTAIPNREDGMPSQRVIEDVQRAKERMHVCAATGRPFYGCKPILDTLKIISPCVISGGTQIIEPDTEKILWERSLSVAQVAAILQICNSYPYEIYFSDDLQSSLAKDKEVTHDERVLYIMTVPENTAEELAMKLQTVQGVAVHAVRSWTAGCMDIHITHSEATKKHALEVLFEMLSIEKEHTIVIGDSNNDLPLYEVGGFKVAMGNGSELLKSKADYIAPSVEEDGVSEVIRKFVLR